jgi:hypothetical protein
MKKDPMDSYSCRNPCSDQNGYNFGTVNSALNLC